MGTIILLLFQLWNQPSVRMLGLGRDFSGFVPDPITDLIRNPAHLKTIGKNEIFTDALQVYSMIRSFSSTALDTQALDLQFYEKEGLVSLFAMHPKVGFVYRLGSWQRWDRRNHGESEPWPYGQQGFLGALNIGRHVKVGAEYSCSWNNGPDWIQQYRRDTLSNQQEASLTHLEWSDEVGFGIIVTNNANMLFSLSGKINWESDEYTADTTWWFWPEGKQTVYENQYADLQLYAQLRYNTEQLSAVLQLDYFMRDAEEWIFDFSWLANHRLYSYRPGFSVIYQPYDDVITVAAVICEVYRFESFTKAIKITVPVGFEKEFKPALQLRFGSTLTYGYYYNTYHRFKNDINLGLDIRPYEKLCFYFATQDLLDDAQWLFGLRFAL